jgi:hypothetical protein
MDPVPNPMSIVIQTTWAHSRCSLDASTIPSIKKEVRDLSFVNLVIKRFR